jgi:hypothetical protein
LVDASKQEEGDVSPPPPEDAVKRAAYVAFVLGGSAFIVIGTAAALHGTPAAYRVEAPPEPLPSLAEMQAGCVQAGGTWWQGTEDGVLLARCYPLPGVGVVPVKRGGK